MINLKLFWGSHRKWLFLSSIFFGMVTGIINLLIIFIITHVDEIIRFGGGGLFIAGFIITTVLYLVSNYFSLAASSKLTNKIILDLRLKIQKYILGSNYKHIEKMGNDSLYAINNDDISKIEHYAEVLPRVMINIFTIGIILGYMMFIDSKVTLVFIAISTLTLLLFYGIQNFLKSQYAKSRAMMDKVVGNINSLITGIRELRVNAHMRKAFFNIDSMPILSKYHKQQTLTSKYEQMTISWFWISYYIVLGISIYVLQEQHIEHKTKFIVPLLMIFGPMTMIMSVISIFYSAKVALDKINALHINEIIFHKKTVTDFKLAQIIDVEYIYPDEDVGVSFGLGPINFNITPGKVVFIVGGNGSGKSTLVKIITCLYTMSKGKIVVNGSAITTEENIENYQSYLTIIYQNPHIFSTILAVDIIAKQSEFLSYLKLFELEERVILEGNRFVNLDKLSYGQKKRLGLLIALLEDKPVYIFDEWAADQDPYFRRIFYLTILPKLKSNGKAIIAITHDEEYFDQADEIIKLREGKQVAAI